jgi:hypothetical protein
MLPLMQVRGHGIGTTADKWQWADSVPLALMLTMHDVGSSCTS